MPRPAEWFAAALKEALARRGIKVSGEARCLVWPQTTVLAVSSGCGAVNAGRSVSPPLREIVRGFMKPSQNLEVDMLVGAHG